MSFTRIQVSNFRCIHELDLALPPLTVVVGPNGAGKSTLLHSLRMFYQVAEGNLGATFSDFGGFDAATCWHHASSEMKFGVSTTTESVLLEYNIALQKERLAYVVADENVVRAPAPSIPEDERPVVRVMRIDGHPGAPASIMSDGRGYVLHSSDTSRSWCFGSTTRGLDIGPTKEPFVGTIVGEVPDVSDLVARFRRISRWNIVDFPLGTIRRPQPLEPAEYPTPNGENLLSVLYALRTEQRERYEEMLEALRVAFPDLESIELPLAGKGFASLNWFQKGLKKPLDAQQLSDGTLRLLWLVTVLHTVPDDGLVLIDEPEISLHPQWLMFLVGLLRQTSARTQIVVATHSDQLIRWLEPDELLVADIEDGVSRFRWGSEMNLDEWLKKYTLDELWLMGELGGRR